MLPSLEFGSASMPHKYRSKSPPEAVPFRRGSFRQRAAAPTRDEAPYAWITPALVEKFSAEDTTAHRLASGPNAWLERFGEDVLLSYKTEPDRDALMAELDARCPALGFPPRRIFGKYLPQHSTERDVPVLLHGDAALPLMTEVRENGVRYGIDFAGGYSAGLFIDQRGNRARLRAARPKRVLNTFAYTCSFSVVAALAGAETVSIDLSRRSLSRGEENFQRNRLDPRAGHQFIADDVLAVLPRLERRGEKFDAIILDPPTFSRNQSGAAFQVQRDFERLVALALDVAAPRARLLLSVNHSGMRVTDLELAARQAMKLAGMQGSFEASPPLADFPPGHGAKTVWLTLR
jgi:23S rRNA (cytosine1962-C5)-methyltransferase